MKFQSTIPLHTPYILDQFFILLNCFLFSFCMKMFTSFQYKISFYILSLDIFPPVFWIIFQYKKVCPLKAAFEYFPFLWQILHRIKALFGFDSFIIHLLFINNASLFSFWTSKTVILFSIDGNILELCFCNEKVYIKIYKAYSIFILLLMN